MIIKKTEISDQFDYLKQEQDGLKRAIDKLDKRFQNNEVDRETFFKGMENFALKQQDLNKRKDKLNR